MFKVIAIICFVLSVIFFIMTVFLYFHYDIKKVYNFLTGKTALNEIKEISKGMHINKKKSDFIISQNKNKTEEILFNNEPISFNSKTKVLDGDSTTILSSPTIDLMEQRVNEEIEFILEDTEMVINTEKTIDEVKL